MVKVSKKTGQRFCNVVFPEIVTQKVVLNSNDLAERKKELSARNYLKMLSENQNISLIQC